MEGDKGSLTKTDTEREPGSNKERQRWRNKDGETMQKKNHDKYQYGEI